MIVVDGPVFRAAAVERVRNHREFLLPSASSSSPPPPPRWSGPLYELCGRGSSSCFDVSDWVSK